MAHETSPGEALLKVTAAAAQVEMHAGNAGFPMLEIAKLFEALQYARILGVEPASITDSMRQGTVMASVNLIPGNDAQELGILQSTLGYEMHVRD